MTRYLAVVLIGTGIMIPAVASAAEKAGAQAPQAQQATTDDCDRLITTLDQRKSETLPVTMEQARAYKSAGNLQACRQANDQLQAAANGQPATDQQAATGSGKVLVQQPAPKVSVDQAPAEVTVSQGQPQIMIHQPAPTITVDIPQAEVVVRMPQPEVAVKQQKPQVLVEQAKPEVAVAPAEGKEQAKVQLEGNGQPAVQYQADEPKVVINKPKDQPKVRFEQVASSEANPDQSKKPADQAAGQGGMQKLQVSQIKQMAVVNDHGDNLGTVEGVTVKNGTKDGYVILRAGQFLGIGEKTVVVPFANMWVRGNQLVVTGLTNEQIGALTEWKSGDTNFKPLADDQVAEMKIAS